MPYCRNVPSDYETKQTFLKTQWQFRCCIIVKPSPRHEDPEPSTSQLKFVLHKLVSASRYLVPKRLTLRFFKLILATVIFHSVVLRNFMFVYLLWYFAHHECKSPDFISSNLLILKLLRHFINLKAALLPLPLPALSCAGDNIELIVPVIREICHPRYHRCTNYLNSIDYIDHFCSPACFLKL